ncbi:hypothetical protein B0H14DRAFT_2596353 [Mycena olivaceomarginata]|nr:hypothetical protein B0H14DRAFT_2596353 [Mycena olivaceomarginata]
MIAADLGILPCTSTRTSSSPQASPAPVAKSDKTDWSPGLPELASPAPVAKSDKTDWSPARSSLSRGAFFGLRGSDPEPDHIRFAGSKNRPGYLLVGDKLSISIRDSVMSMERTSKMLYSSSPKVNTNGCITLMQETLPITKEPGSSHSPILSTPDNVHAIHCTTEWSSGALGIKTTWHVKISAIGRVWDEYSVQKELQIMYFALRKPPNKFGSKAAMNAPRQS